MNTQMRRGLIAIGLLVGGVLPLEPAHSAINPITVVAGSPTISIIDTATGLDISATWLPEPGQTVRLVVNGLAGATITLDEPNTTSHPGICTNYTGTGSGLDFSLAGDQLTAKDCAGIARVLVNTFAFKLPADANNNGIADVWEATRGGNVIANQDLDLSPSTSDATQPTSDPTCLGDCRKGDGIAAFDEYRGFIVSVADKTAGVPFAELPGNKYKHIRTEPTQKDIFVHLVNNQCAPASPPTILGTFARYFTLANGKDPFEFAYTVFPGSIHLLDFTQGEVNPVRSVLWEDFFDSYSVADPDGTGPLTSTVLFLTGGGVRTNQEADVPTDRQINKNAVHPIEDLNTGSTRQKGIRLIECQDTTLASPLGISDWGTPNKAGSIYAIRSGNATMFTDRTRRDIVAQLAKRGSRQIRWSIYNPATAQWVLQATALTPGQSTEDFLTARDLQYLIGHELAHDLQLRPTSANGYHSLTNSGSMMDQTIKVTIDKTNSATNKITFNIPSVFLSSDQIEIMTKN